MWRPENWENPYLEAQVVDRERLVFRLPDDGIYIEGKGKEIGTNAFEAGADAMLEALRKKHGVRITEATKMVTQPIFEQGNGYLVFIPDEEK